MWADVDDPDGPAILIPAGADMQGDEEVEGTPAQNVMSAAVYSNGDDVSIVSASGERIHNHVYQSAHHLCTVCLVKPSPCRPEISVQAAVFEHHSIDGYMWVNFSDLMMKLNVEKTHGKASEWFQIRADRWRSVNEKFFHGQFGVLSSQSYGSVADSPRRRCLMFPSVSVKFLVLLALRSAHSGNRNHGLLQTPGSKEAFRLLFESLLGHLPSDFTISVRLDAAPTLAGRG